MAKTHRFDEQSFRVAPNEPLDLAKRSTEAGQELQDKKHAAQTLAADVTTLQEAQNVLFASQSRSLLVIFQGMDAAGKDSTIRHVMGGVNPQGCRVYSFRAPNETELMHHFLWRAMPCLPARGMISLFNRSYYEETLVVRVHPEFLLPQRIPGIQSLESKTLERLWRRRYEEVNAFEQTLVDNGTVILKFFLHVSKQEQKKRFLDRLTEPEKHWKFNARDLSERKLWGDYQHAFEQTLSHTSTSHAPWYVIPADDKWYMRAAIADIIAAKLESLELTYPTVSESERLELAALAEQLKAER